MPTQYRPRCALRHKTCPAEVQVGWRIYLDNVALLPVTVDIALTKHRIERVHQLEVAVVSHAGVMNSPVVLETPEVLVKHMYEQVAISDPPR